MILIVFRFPTKQICENLRDLRAKLYSILFPTFFIEKKLRKSAVVFYFPQIAQINAEECLH